jgi:hypothetical protein
MSDYLCTIHVFCCVDCLEKATVTKLAAMLVSHSCVQLMLIVFV